MPIKQAVHDFIQDRMQAKLDKAKTEEEQESLKEKYQPFTWIADAARRAAQIQFATHTVKGVHPDSKGTNINAQFQALPDGLVGSGSLKQYQLDVVGNAAALDVYKFLSIRIDEQTTLLDLVLQEDKRLLPIFAQTPEMAQEYIQAFKSIAQNSTSKAKTYELMKQLLWPLHEQAQQQDDYVNIVPLYPSAFVHEVFKNIQESRFGEQAKQAKEARKNNQLCEEGYVVLPNIAYVKLGGTKPQNVSQLNSERGGRNYLLPSLPPKFEYQGIRAPIYEYSIFKRAFPYFARYDINRLCKSVIEQENNIDVRIMRKKITKSIMSTLISYGAYIRSLPGGWSIEATKLNQAQALWLDPKRADIDEEWAIQRRQINWQVIVAEDFALWLNKELEIIYSTHSIEYEFGKAEELNWKHEMLSIIKQTVREGWGVFE